VSPAARESRTVHLLLAGTALAMAVLRLPAPAVSDVVTAPLLGATAALAAVVIGRPMAIADLRAFLDAFDPALLGVATPEMDTAVHLVGQAG
jgi:hypothetical protein